MIVGIDNGSDGAAVAIGPLGHIIGSFVMPTFKRKKITKKGKDRKNREIDSLQLAVMLENLILSRDAVTVIFEECPDHARSASAMRGMGINAGKILGVLEARRLTVHRITSADWHPVILGKFAKGESKNAARAKVKELWPDEVWRNKKTDFHTGLVDAALISYFGLLTIK